MIIKFMDRKPGWRIGGRSWQAGSGTDLSYYILYMRLCGWMERTELRFCSGSYFYEVACDDDGGHIYRSALHTQGESVAFIRCRRRRWMSFSGGRGT